MSDHAVITVLLCAVVIETTTILILLDHRVQAVAPAPGRVDPTREWTDLPDRSPEDWLPEAPTTAALHLWITSTDGTPVQWQALPNPPKWSYRAAALARTA